MEKKKDSYLIIGLHRIVNELDRKTGRIAREHGLTLGQFAVLEALYHKGALTVGEIRDAILGSDGTVPVIVQNLEKQGLVARTRDAADRRRSVVALTEEGAARIGAAYPENEAMFRSYFSAWTEHEKDTLLAIFRAGRERRKGE